jgi:hypothetical protein
MLGFLSLRMESLSVEDRSGGTLSWIAKIAHKFDGDLRVSSISRSVCAFWEAYLICAQFSQ